MTGGREAPAYHLPLKFKSKIGEFSLRVEVVKAAAPPQVTKGELTNFAFQQWRDSYVAETKQQNWTPVEDLVIALPKTEGPQVLVEKADDGQTYFAIQDYPKQTVAQIDQITAIPKRVVVFWDASGSRSGDHKREIAVLRGYLEALLPNLHSGAMPVNYEAVPINVDLVVLRNVLGKPVRIRFPIGGTSALTAALESVQYDGGTQLGAIEPIPGAEKPDFYMLFTDGISNFGSEEPARLDAPLYIFSADAGANHALLHSLAMSNGGRYFNLANWKDADIFAQAGKPAWSFLATKIDGGEAADLYPQRPQPLGGRFTLVGKLTGETATVTADYGLAGGKPDKQTFKVSRSEAASGSLLQRLWAGKKLAELMIHQKQNEHEIAALGKKFNLVTPYTSLLVLDSLEQYVRYDIAPPKSLPAMREEYMRRIDTIEHQKQKEKADKVERGGPHVAGAGQLVDQRVQVSQGLQVCGPGGSGGTDGGAAARARRRQGRIRRTGGAAARHHSVVCRPRGGAGAGTAIRGEPGRRSPWQARSPSPTMDCWPSISRRPGPYRETSRNEPAFLAASPASSSSRGTPTRPI